MATIFMRLMRILRGEKTPTERIPDELADRSRLDVERAERGLELSGIDSDPRTTQALSDELGIRTRLDREEGDEGAARKAA